MCKSEKFGENLILVYDDLNVLKALSSAPHKLCGLILLLLLLFIYFEVKLFHLKCLVSHKMHSQAGYHGNTLKLRIPFPRSAVDRK